MNRAVRIVTIGLAAAGGVLVVLVAISAWALRRPQYVVPGEDITRYVAGRWDWSTRVSPCRDSAHTIAFSPDRKLMTITSEYVARSDSERVATYDLLNVSRSSFRGAIRGETRRTPSGVPVVWDLVLFSPTEYRWHRTDWNSWGYTAAVIRCDPSS
jgi:hypothetical protein